MKPKEILIAARAKIENPENWTQGSYSRNIDGVTIDSPKSKAAVCWCSRGAIIAISETYEDEDLAMSHLRNAIESKYPTVVGFNDSSTHVEVLSAFDRAISLAD